MTNEQKKWAAQHDWFLAESPNGVWCLETMVRVGFPVSTRHVEFTDFKSLKNWAGY